MSPETIRDTLRYLGRVAVNILDSTNLKDKYPIEYFNLKDAAVLLMNCLPHPNLVELD
jgi:hypothetical protein